MGYASEQTIDEHNERMATDERYAADYDEAMRIDAALEAEWFAQEKENEKQVDWFDDLKIDYTGYAETIETALVSPLPIDDDIPF